MSEISILNLAVAGCLIAQAVIFQYIPTWLRGALLLVAALNIAVAFT